LLEQGVATGTDCLASCAWHTETSILAMPGLRRRTVYGFWIFTLFWNLDIHNLHWFFEKTPPINSYSMAAFTTWSSCSQDSTVWSHQISIHFAGDNWIVVAFSDEKDQATGDAYSPKRRVGLDLGKGNGRKLTMLCLPVFGKNWLTNDLYQKKPVWSTCVVCCLSSVELLTWAEKPHFPRTADTWCLGYSWVLSCPTGLNH
jgi:hypothetical protein